MFERDELLAIREKAVNCATVEGINPVWRQALYNLATAADHLDAMIVRSQVIEDEPRTLEEVDDYLRQCGYDPDEVGAKMKAVAEAALEAALARV